MGYTRIDKSMAETLCQIVGEGNYKADLETLDRYGRDYTEDLSFTPELVLFPSNTSMVSQIAKYCNTHQIALISENLLKRSPRLVENIHYLYTECHRHER